MADGDAFVRSDRPNADERLSHWRIWEEFDQADYFNRQYWQKLTDTMTDSYKNTCDLLYKEEFCWLSMKSVQQIFKYCEHRYSVAIRKLRAICKALCLAHDVADLDLLKGRYVEFELNFPSGKARRIRWKLLSRIDRGDECRTTENLNEAAMKEKQWEAYRHLRNAQWCNRPASEVAKRTKAEELRHDVDEIRVIRDVKQH